uniref:RRM domain-containing protein n=1 Tax=Eutreptiella gymnastica TaxID=73025 RepID=A0A7S1I8B6_9EUGL
MAPKKASKPAAKKAAPKAAPKPAAPAKKAKKAEKKKGGGAERPQVTGVYVTGLDFEGMSHETVKEQFKHCQNITEVRLRHGKYALIFFGTKANANKALEMNKKLVKGNKISVVLAKRARPTKVREGKCTTVFVGGLPGATTKKQLATHFADCGSITKVRVYSKHYGFVYFDSAAAATKAVAMGDVPFSHGKDTSRMEEVPHQLSRTLEVKYSIRTKASDAVRNEKRYNRRPPSAIEAAEKKAANRVASHAAAKAAKEAEKKKAAGSAAKGSTTKKSSTTKK